ncbi:hypothetical protein Bbelb_353500 [Branchiostoma belcheri]|nr:hypothetical protein Bbelb_353500 [Branchiostoma belcheri]
MSQQDTVHVHAGIVTLIEQTFYTPAYCQVYCAQPTVTSARFIQLCEVTKDPTRQHRNNELPGRKRFVMPQQPPRDRRGPTRLFSQLAGCCAPRPRLCFPARAVGLARRPGRKSSELWHGRLNLRL